MLIVYICGYENLSKHYALRVTLYIYISGLAAAQYKKKKKKKPIELVYD